jgi:rubrerythrin
MTGTKTRRINKIRSTIQANIADETDDIKEYRDGAKHVDRKTAKVFREIARDEVSHKKKLLKLLR